MNHFFNPSNGKALCFLCNDTVAMLKQNNIFGHYQTEDSSQYSQIVEKQWSEK